MFDNPGTKTKTLALVCFVIQIIGAVILLFTGLFFLFDGEPGAGLYLIGAVVAAFMAWVTAIPMMALGDAAEDAAIAALNSKRALEILEKYEEERKAANKAADKSAPEVSKPKQAPVTNYPGERIPAWKRVQMENDNN